MSEAAALRADRLAEGLLVAFGLEAQAAAIDALMLPSALRELPRLRQVLIGVAREKAVVSYEDLRLSLDLVFGRLFARPQ